MPYPRLPALGTTPPGPTETITVELSAAELRVLLEVAPVDSQAYPVSVGRWARTLLLERALVIAATAAPEILERWPEP